MNWIEKKAAFGDMIRVKTGALYHYGIYVSDSEIVQFGLNPALWGASPEKDITVCASGIDTFLNGGKMEVAHFEQTEPQKNAEQTVEKARSRIGEGGYSLLYNNCEHFAFECKTGKKYCFQTESVRNMFKSLAGVDVYTAELPTDKTDSVYSEQRTEYINSASNPLVKNQRLYVWKLLEYAINRSFGLKPSDVEFTKTEHGKWLCNKCHVSLSHSGGALAVAVSRKPVGVDIENAEKIMKEKLSERILTKCELESFKALTPDKKSEFLLEKWTAKESIFKKSEDNLFCPSAIETDTDVKTMTVSVGDKNYLLSVCSNDVSKLRLYENIKL